MKNEKLFCRNVRKRIVEQGYKSGRGHISSALSLVEICCALYNSDVIDIQKIKENDEYRDRVILSKGHGALGLYATLCEIGIIPEDMLDGFATQKGQLSTHPVKGSATGIEMTAGSLGQGIGYASGVALGAKIGSDNYKTFVIVGDGELQEGSNWEALLFAAQQKLNNLTIIVDRNKLQITGNVDKIVAIEPLAEKFRDFNFDVYEVDGHNVDEIYNVLEKKTTARPKVMIANTVKGKGISFIENKNGWHGKGLTKEQYILALEELEG